jgi:hypothetical protein
VKVAAAGEKHISDFEGALVKDLVGLCGLYEHNIQSIRGLCSLMPEGEPSTMDYIRRLSVEVTGLPEVFAGVNENFISAAVEGTLTMAGDSVNIPPCKLWLLMAGWTFCPSSRMCDEPCGQCQKNGGNPSATIMC